MKLTKNYGLKKPDGEDFYNVQDFNDNADAIDAALAAKPDLPAAAEPGHFAAFSAGGIADSGKAAADFLPAGTTPADIGAATAQAHSTLSAAQNAHANDAAKHFSAAEKAKLQKAYTTDDIVVSSAQPTAAEGRIWIRI